MTSTNLADLGSASTEKLDKEMLEVQNGRTGLAALLQLVLVSGLVPFHRDLVEEKSQVGDDPRVTNRIGDMIGILCT